MPDKEVDKELVDDLKFYYIEKRRLTNKNFNYIPTQNDDSYFQKAAQLCEKCELHPGKYVNLLYDRMETKKEFFKPQCLQGTKVEHFLVDYNSGATESYEVEITNATIDYQSLWTHQHELALRYIRQGEDVSSVLLNSSLKFFAWYRILSTPRPVPAVIEKYKLIARKELNNRLTEFIKSENLDISRILD
jgi:hypothetical protein